MRRHKVAALLPAPDRDLNAVGANHERRVYIEEFTGTTPAFSQTSSPTASLLSFGAFFQCSQHVYTVALGKQVIEVLVMPVGFVLHCKENRIYVFLFWELPSPNFHIHVSESDLYIPRIGPHNSLQQNRQIDPRNRHINLSHI
jgi:hypothetical protein